MMKTTKRHDPVRERAGRRAAPSAANTESPHGSRPGTAPPHRLRRYLFNVRSAVLVAALGTAGVLATVGTIGSWPPIAGATEPTAADKIADLKHLGLGIDGLLAGGLTVNQAAGVLDWIGSDRVRFNTLRVAQSQVTIAEQLVEGIRGEMVRTGRTEELDEAFASAQAQLANAKTNYNGLVVEARSALGILINGELNGQASWPLLSRIISNNARSVPVALKVLELSPSQWAQVENYYAKIEKFPEVLDPQTVAIAESLAVNSEVANAQSRIEQGVPVLLQSLIGG